MSGNLPHKVNRQRVEDLTQAGQVSAARGASGYLRRPAVITANNGDGSYAVDIYDDAGAVVAEDELVHAFPKSANALAVGTAVWIEYAPGRPKGVLDATAYAIGGAGAGSGSVIVVGAPGFLSGT